GGGGGRAAARAPSTGRRRSGRGPRPPPPPRPRSRRSRGRALARNAWSRIRAPRRSWLSSATTVDQLTDEDVVRPVCRDARREHPSREIERPERAAGAEVKHPPAAVHEG